MEMDEVGQAVVDPADPGMPVAVVSDRAQRRGRLDGEDVVVFPREPGGVASRAGAAGRNGAIQALRAAGSCAS